MLRLVDGEFYVELYDNSRTHELFDVAGPFEDAIDAELAADRAVECGAE